MQHIEFTRQSPDGIQFRYQGWLPDTDPRAVVCLVHGIGEHTGRYAHVAAALNAAGYALLGCDLRGHGRSGGPRGHTPSYAALLDDIDRLLEEAAHRHPGLPRFLYGHSLGGNLVLNYALRSDPGLRSQPAVTGVIATSPALRLATPPPALQVALVRAINKVYGGLRIPNGLDLEGLARDPEVIRAYTKDPLVHNQVSVRLALGMFESGEWALAHAAGFPLPLLLVHGTQDKLTSAKASEEFAAQVPGGRCTLKLWEGFYHETHNEPEQAQVLQFMIDWLNRSMPCPTT